MQPEIEKYREDGLTVLVAALDSSDVMKSILEEYELDVVVLDDREGHLRQIFRVRGVPSGFLYDREGNLIDTEVGWHREQSLSGWIDKVKQALYE